jgi:glycosyltransferase involved in cell wall biosynthesis
VRTKQLTVVIPNKQGQSPELSIRTLYRQGFTDFDIIIINDDSGNANIARNAGLTLVHTPYVLFCDNDINWAHNALQLMMDCLTRHTDISYAYGHYELSGKIWCNKEWDAAELKRRNYVSTMSIVRTAHHPGFDEKIKRLQDWDVWLSMLAQGKKGKYTGSLIFTTPARNGITRNSIGWEEAIGAIKAKHKI